MLQGKMYVFCDKTCIDEFRRTHYIMAQCVYCKIEKVVKEVKRINNADCSFCSEGEVPFCSMWPRWVSGKEGKLQKCHVMIFTFNMFSCESI